MFEKVEFRCLRRDLGSFLRCGEDRWPVELKICKAILRNLNLKLRNVLIQMLHHFTASLLSPRSHCGKKHGRRASATYSDGVHSIKMIIRCGCACRLEHLMIIIIILNILYFISFTRESAASGREVWVRSLSPRPRLRIDFLFNTFSPIAAFAVAGSAPVGRRIRPL